MPADHSPLYSSFAFALSFTVELYRSDRRPLPPATSGRDYANKMQRVA